MEPDEEEDEPCVPMVEEPEDEPWVPIVEEPEDEPWVPILPVDEDEPWDPVEPCDVEEPCVALGDEDEELEPCVSLWANATTANARNSAISNVTFFIFSKLLSDLIPNFAETTEVVACPEFALRDLGQAITRPPCYIPRHILTVGFDFRRHNAENSVSVIRMFL